MSSRIMWDKGRNSKLVEQIVFNYITVPKLCSQIWSDFFSFVLQSCAKDSPGCPFFMNLSACEGGSHAWAKLPKPPPLKNAPKLFFYFKDMFLKKSKATFSYYPNPPPSHLTNPSYDYNQGSIYSLHVKGATMGTQVLFLLLFMGTFCDLIFWEHHGTFPIKKILPMK